MLLQPLPKNRDTLSDPNSAGQIRARFNRRPAVSRIAGFITAIGATLILGATAAGACAPTGPSGSSSLRSVVKHGHALSGMVGTVNASSFTLTNQHGIVWTVDVTPQTTFSESGSPVSYSALMAGDKVAVKGAVDSTQPDTFQATSVELRLAHLSGTVVSAASGTFTLSDHNNFWRVVIESSSTVYSVGPKAVAVPTTAANIVPGVRVEVSGNVDPNHTSLDATSVRIKLASIAGSVTAVTPAGFTLSTSGGSIAVATSPSTVYFNRSGATSAGSLTVGMSAIAFGTQTGSGTFSANFVGIQPLRGGHHDSDGQAITYLTSFMTHGSPPCGKGHHHGRR